MAPSGATAKDPTVGSSALSPVPRLARRKAPVRVSIDRNSHAPVSPLSHDHAEMTQRPSTRSCESVMSANPSSWRLLGLCTHRLHTYHRRCALVTSVARRTTTRNTRTPFGARSRVLPDRHVTGFLGGGLRFAVPAAGDTAARSVAPITTGARNLLTVGMA